MRNWALRSLVCLAVFACASRGLAATVDITLSLVPSTTTWELRVDSLSAAQVGAIALLVSDSLEGFTSLLPPEMCICLPELPVPAGPGLHTFNLIGNGAGTIAFSGIVGRFESQVSSAALVQVLPGDALYGFTVLDTGGNAIFDVAIQVTPEPGASALLLLAALGVALRLTRRRSAS